jgi:hypothetical protein
MSLGDDTSTGWAKSFSCSKSQALSIAKLKQEMIHDIDL